MCQELSTRAPNSFVYRHRERWCLRVLVHSVKLKPSRAPRSPGVTRGPGRRSKSAYAGLRPAVVRMCEPSPNMPGSVLAIICAPQRADEWEMALQRESTCLHARAVRRAAEIVGAIEALAAQLKHSGRAYKEM